MKRIVILIALAFVVGILGATPPTGAVDHYNQAWVPAMNQTSYWAPWDCTKYDNHGGWIPAQYDAAIIKAGQKVRVYPDLTSTGAFQASAPDGKDISWVMKCKHPTQATTTTTLTSTTSTSLPNTTSTTSTPPTTGPSTTVPPSTSSPATTSTSTSTPTSSTSLPPVTSTTAPTTSTSSPTTSPSSTTSTSSSPPSTSSPTTSSEPETTPSSAPPSSTPVDTTAPPRPTPTASTPSSPTPNVTLPETGSGSTLALIAAAILLGGWALVASARRGTS